jgi:phage tail sheath gpL-like
MVTKFIAINPGTPLYAAPVLAVGNAASFVITVTVATTVTQAGTVRVTMGADSPIDTSYTTTDGYFSIATAIAANINANVNLPVTALAAVTSSTTATVTISAKVVGARGNWLRASARVLSGTGVTVSPTKQSFFTSGSGSDSYTNVLNFLSTNGILYYYYVTEAGCDSVDGTLQFEAVDAVIDTLAQPTIGLRQRLIAGSVDTYAHTSAITMASAVNDARAECIWLQNSDLPPSELAAIATACYTLFEVPPLAASGVNFDGFGNDAISSQFWKVPAPLDGTAPSTATIKSCMTSGVTCVKVQRGGTSIVKRITTRCQNGSNIDLRITDSGKVTIVDYFSNDLINLLSLRFARKLIANDPPTGTAINGAGIVTPGLVRNVVLELINQYGAANLINSINSTQGLVVQREISPSSRISIRVPLFTADPLHTIGISVDQVS